MEKRKQFTDNKISKAQKINILGFIFILFKTIKVIWNY